MLTIIVLLNSCTSGKSKNIIANVTVIERLNPKSLQVKKGIFYSIKIDLINNTDTVLKFWTMTCSWQINWIFENRQFRFFVNCPKNYEIIKQIEPHEKIVYNGIIELVDTTYVVSDKRFKVGFVLVKDNEADRIGFISTLDNKIKINKDIIWSEPFKIDK